ncbi:hypothetical protein Hypma_002059 [Hypsizygus marmoreus]|uniref:Uncharacterized protein n=1 Tax=Hypsizygus marmoreus TaxID=39966 RepID=A0A369J6K5_HYPMA|nr:hypothetical protein Hypma_002059 [Hypsizygus marmoreus]
MLSVLNPLQQLRPSSKPLKTVSLARGAQGSQAIIAKLDKPLVSTEYINAHLELLPVFHKVHHAIQPGGVTINPTTNMPIVSEAQALFTARAQHRFDLWISRILRRPGRDPSSPFEEAELPPVDVLMFLHAYMLSPWNYYEDSKRVYPELEAMGSFPFGFARALVDVATLELVPTPAQIAMWESQTSTTFAIPLQTLPAETVLLCCPKCDSEVRLPWVNEAGTGYGQRLFKATCSQCNLNIDRDALSLSKLLRDISSPRIMAHTLLSRSGVADLASAQEFSLAIKEELGLPRSSDGDQFNWKVSVVESILTRDVKSDGVKKKLLHILKAYHHPSESSLDLGQAFLRQARFISEMDRIQWSGSKASFPGKEAALEDAVERYHKFVALDPVAMVACLDIDLAFHTHQLLGPTFAQDSINILGRLLDHDDSVERHVIIDDLTRTSEVWEEAYASAYVPRFPPLLQANKPCTNSCSMVGSTPGEYEEISLKKKRN